MKRVLDPGPIPYSQTALYRDADLEHGLRHFGRDPDTTFYRLIELPVSAISDSASMPHRVWNRDILEAINPS